MIRDRGTEEHQCERNEPILHKRGDVPVQLPCINLYSVHRYSIVVSRCLASPKMNHREILKVVIIGEDQTAWALNQQVRCHGFSGVTTHTPAVYNHA